MNRARGYCFRIDVIREILEEDENDLSEYAKDIYSYAYELEVS